MQAPFPADESARLAALHACHILDTPPEASFDRIVKLASQTLDMPIAAVSFVDCDRQWSKAHVGSLPSREIPREFSFCAHAILEGDICIVPDAANDARFADNPLVHGKAGIRFYAAAALRTPDFSHVLGVLCVMDSRPRSFDERQRQILSDLASLAIDELTLRAEVRARQQAEASLRAQNLTLQELHASSNALSEQRLAELGEANPALHAEILQRRHADQERRRSEHRFRQLFNQASDAAFLHDVNGRFVDVNEAACTSLGYTREELLRLGVPELEVTHVPAEGFQFWRELPAGTVEKFEGCHRRRDGSTFPVEVHVSVLDSSEGRHLLALVRDITERKRAEAELRQAKEEAEKANHAKSEFLSRMSHELRTPLNAILGFGQILEMSPLVRGEHDSVAHILTGGRHLLKLIDEVLDIARIESGRLELSSEPVPIFDLLQEALCLIRPLAAQRGICLQPPDFRALENAVGRDPHVTADRQRLKQVLLNLLSNAVKYNVDGGSVSLQCALAASPGRVRLRVADTGKGIPVERRAQLFTPFERLGAEFSVVEGTGLGLALSKRLIETMGGSIGMEGNTVEGKPQGAVFWVELPLAANPLDVVGESAEGTARSAPKEVLPAGKTILYIEDNLSNLRLIERLLANYPEVRLLTAMQGGLGLELARQHRPDLILLDVHLPDLPGPEVLAKLGADPATQDIPVIVISADATERQMERMRAAGAHSYLTKPIDVRLFMEAIRQTLAADAKPTTEFLRPELI